MGCHFFLQGIFPTQRLNPHLCCLLHWQVDSLLREPPGKLFFTQPTNWAFQKIYKPDPFSICDFLFFKATIICFMLDFISKHSILFSLWPSFSGSFSYFFFFLSILNLSLVKTFIFIVYVCLRLFFACLCLSHDFGLSSCSSTAKRLPDHPIIQSTHTLSPTFFLSLYFCIALLIIWNFILILILLF